MIYSQSFFFSALREFDAALAKVRLFKLHLGREDGIERAQNLFTLAGRCRYTRPVAHWLPK